MKKILSIIIVAAVLSLSIMPVFAGTNAALPQNQNVVSFKEVLKPLWDELKTLRQDAKDLMAQIKSERETVKNLIQAKRQAKDHEAIKSAREFETNNIAPKRIEIKNLRAQKAQAWQDLRKAKENKDVEGAKTALQNIINLKTQINADLRQILDNMKQMENMLK